MNHQIHKIKLIEGEYWWGGATDHGVHMPFGEKQYGIDLRVNIAGNQANPLLISSKGRYVWSEKAFKFEISEGFLMIEGIQNAVEIGEGHHSLREVYRFVSEKFFHANGKLPDLMLFTAPQYNTWIEMMYEPTQEKTLQYAENVLKNNMPAGVLMIDDNWQEDYGTWGFHKERFPKPAELTRKLHELGFKVMLWVCPFVSPDSFTFRMLEQKGYLLKNATGETAIRHWWNGYSAVLDCTHPGAVRWFEDCLEELRTQYGIDGFKFDAGDPEFYEDDDIGYLSTNSNFSIGRNEHCEAWARIGLKFPLNEYRACWKMAGQPLVQRLRDKFHNWDQNGIASLIPNGLAQGILGYAFNCPDLIGGGDFMSFLGDHFSIDQELVVRYAQCSALFPMMQFSAAPWRVLDEEHLSYCVEAAKLHASMGPIIEELAVHAANTGEPILRYMAYEFPDSGYENISDQFMIGPEILVAPATIKGMRERVIVFPEGKWVGDDGTVVAGPCAISVKVPLSRLPWYKKSR